MNSNDTLASLRARRADYQKQADNAHRDLRDAVRTREDAGFYGHDVVAITEAAERFNDCRALLILMEQKIAEAVANG